MIRIEDEENNKPEDENATVKKGESSSWIILLGFTRTELGSVYSERTRKRKQNFL